MWLYMEAQTIMCLIMNENESKSLNIKLRLFKYMSFLCP